MNTTFFKKIWFDHKLNNVRSKWLKKSDDENWINTIVKWKVKGTTDTD